jgi:hypothetical protein
MRWLAVALAAGVCAAMAYVRWLRPWQMRWGATEGEVRRAMALDGRVRNPQYVSTRAVTIEARPEEVWPWLVQMGDGERAGFYSYTWIERLMGMKIENSGRLLPDIQDLQVGDALDRAGNMVVKGLREGRWLVLGPPETEDAWIATTWAFAIYSAGGDRCRLVTRVRGGVKRWSPLAVAWVAMMDPGVFVMERKMLLGIKERAERLAARRRQLEVRVGGV